MSGPSATGSDITPNERAGLRAMAKRQGLQPITRLLDALEAAEGIAKTRSDHLLRMRRRATKAERERDEARAETERLREALKAAEVLIAEELEPHESEPEGVSPGVDATRFVLKQARAALEPRDA